MLFLGFIVICLLISNPVLAEDKGGFTKEDRERLIRLEATIQTYMQVTDKRFEDMNKRFEDMNRRLEEMSKRIDETRQDMNKRYDDLRVDMNNLRMDTNSRFDQLIIYLSILAGVFTALIIFLIAYLFWDRRTFLRRARDEAVERIERDYRLRAILQAIFEYAKDDPKFEAILKRHNLM